MKRPWRAAERLAAWPRGGLCRSGPAILAYTKDSAIAGPYHRDAAGILDTYDLFTGPQSARDCCESAASII